MEVVEPMPGDWEVLRASHPHEKIQAFTARWKMPVPKEGEAVHLAAEPGQVHLFDAKTEERVEG